MGNDIFKRPYRLRRAAAAGKEITVPNDTTFAPGYILVTFYDGFILYVPMGTQCNEALLRRAITEKIEARYSEGSVGKRLPDAPEAQGA